MQFAFAPHLCAAGAMSLPLPKRRRHAAEVAADIACEAPAPISFGRRAASAAGADPGSIAARGAQETGSGSLMVGSICSGIGVCHRASAAVNSCNADVTLRDAFACEVARSARQVLAADFPGLRLFGDVCEDGSRLPPCDVLVTGFPCQPFSAANRRRKGSSDTRCEVLSHIIRYIERVAPSLIVMENVVGLLSHGRDVFLNLVQRLQAAGYSIAVKVLRSEVHGGVPQRRHRLFIVALRSPTAAMGWPGSIPMRSLPSILAKDVCPPGARPSAPKAAGKIDAVERCLVPCSVTEAESAHMVVNCHSQLGRLFIGKTPCLTAARGAQGGFWLLGQRRMMHVDELLLLQGIDPASTRIRSAVSARQAGFLIGNAFTLPLIARVLVCGLRALGFEVVDPIEPSCMVSTGK